MIQKIKTLMTSFAALFILALPVAAPALASADTIQGGVCGGALNAGGQTPITSGEGTNDCGGAGDTTSNFDSILARIINIFSVIVGVVAVIMLIVGGFRYITSGGSSDKVSGAKNTILYALIGLVIVALAQVIVKFVLNRTTTA